MRSVFQINSCSLKYHAISNTTATQSDRLLFLNYTFEEASYKRTIDADTEAFLKTSCVFCFPHSGYVILRTVFRLQKCKFAFYQPAIVSLIREGKSGQHRAIHRLTAGCIPQGM